MDRYLVHNTRIAHGVWIAAAAAIMLLVIILATISGCAGSQLPSVQPDAEPAPEPPGGSLVSPQSPTDLSDRQKFVDRQLSYLRAGQLAYRPPSPMKEGNSHRVVVRVSGPAPPPDFEPGLPGAGPIRNRDVNVGSDLMANLSGDKEDFQISRVGDDDGKRTLATGTFAEWQWDVLPLRSGKKTLSLVLYVLLQDENRPLEVKTYDETIEVEVSPMYTVVQWVKAYGPYTGLTVPVIIGFVWRTIHRRKGAATPAIASKEGS